MLTWPEDASYRDQCSHGVGQVLQRLVRVDHVERACAVWHGLDRAQLARSVLEARGSHRGCRLLHDAFNHIDGSHPPSGADVPSQPDSDGAGAAAHIEHAISLPQVRQQERRTVFRSTGGVLADYSFVVAVGVE